MPLTYIVALIYEVYEMGRRLQVNQRTFYFRNPGMKGECNCPLSWHIGGEHLFLLCLFCRAHFIIFVFILSLTKKVWKCIWICSGSESGRKHLRAYSLCHCEFQYQPNFIICESPQRLIRGIGEIWNLTWWKLLFTVSTRKVKLLEDDTLGLRHKNMGPERPSRDHLAHLFLVAEGHLLDWISSFPRVTLALCQLIAFSAIVSA